MKQPTAVQGKIRNSVAAALLFIDYSASSHTQWMGHEAGVQGNFLNMLNM